MTRSPSLFIKLPVLKFRQKIIRVVAAFFAATLICFLETCFYATAWGGPFTVLLALFVLPIFFGGFLTLCALLAGLTGRMPPVKRVWIKMGPWSLCLSALGVAVIFLASKLGLRHLDPVSKYSIMDRWAWWTCLLLIVIPIVNLPAARSDSSTND